MTYFIRYGKHVKIGCSNTSGASRLKALKIGFPTDDFEILCETFEYGSDEKVIHELFKEYRTRGEWFIYSDDIKRFLQIIYDIGDQSSMGDYIFKCDISEVVQKFKEGKKGSIVPEPIWGCPHYRNIKRRKETHLNLNFLKKNA